MKATLNDTVIADAAHDDLISIEGNWYFPPASLRDDLFTKSETQYHCPWKGDAQYFTVRDPATGDMVPDAAWSYPTPIRSSFDRVGKDYSGYVAFAKDAVRVAP